jgi:hypothetical protein
VSKKELKEEMQHQSHFNRFPSRNGVKWFQCRRGRAQSPRTSSTPSFPRVTKGFWHQYHGR